MLDPATQVTFVDGDFYNKDLNNFGPTVGFAWDVTKDGRTAVRGGYSLTFVNEETVTVGRSASRGNAGLSSRPSSSNQFARVAPGVPEVPTPAFLSTRTLADQMALSADGVRCGASIPTSARRTSTRSASASSARWAGRRRVEARYVGTFGRDIWRGIDFNQVKISPDFLADFNRARSNGLPGAAGGPGVQPDLQRGRAGQPAADRSPELSARPATNANVVSNLQTNQVAGLADFYMTNRVTGTLATFMQNPASTQSQGLSNGGFSDYNSLQLELRRQFRNGFFGQVNYTFATPTPTRPARRRTASRRSWTTSGQSLNTGRSAFHVTHAVAGERDLRAAVRRAAGSG